MLKVMLDTQTGRVSLDGGTLPAGVESSLLEGQTRKGFAKLVASLAERHGGKPCLLDCKEPHQIGFLIVNPKNEQMVVSQLEDGQLVLTAILKNPRG